MLVYTASRQVLLPQGMHKFAAAELISKESPVTRSDCVRAGEIAAWPCARLRAVEIDGAVLRCCSCAYSCIRVKL